MGFLSSVEKKAPGAPEGITRPDQFSERNTEKYIPRPMQPRPSLVVGGPAYFTPEGYEAPRQPEQAFMPTNKMPDPIGEQFRRANPRPMDEMELYSPAYAASQNSMSMGDFLNSRRYANSDLQSLFNFDDDRSSLPNVDGTYDQMQPMPPSPDPKYATFEVATMPVGDPVPFVPPVQTTAQQLQQAPVMPSNVGLNFSNPNTIPSEAEIRRRIEAAGYMPPMMPAPMMPAQPPMMPAPMMPAALDVAPVAPPSLAPKMPPMMPSLRPNVSEKMIDSRFTK